jgi:hypothetical protein
MKIPGKNTAIILASIGLVSAIYPILSLPCSITGFFQARSARNFIKRNDLTSDALVNAAFLVTIISMIISVSLMVLAVGVAIGRGAI